MKKLSFILFFITHTALGKTIENCGVYFADGYYTEIEYGPLKEKKEVILIEKGSRSEIIFFIKNRDLKKLIPKTYRDMNFKLKLKFTSACYFYCEGEIIEVIKPLLPTESVKSFLFPRPKVLNKTQQACQKNSVED